MSQSVARGAQPTRLVAQLSSRGSARGAAPLAPRASRCQRVAAKSTWTPCRVAAVAAVDEASFEAEVLKARARCARGGVRR